MGFRDRLSLSVSGQVLMVELVYLQDKFSPTRVQGYA